MRAAKKLKDAISHFAFSHGSEGAEKSIKRGGRLGGGGGGGSVGQKRAADEANSTGGIGGKEVAKRVAISSSKEPPHWQEQYANIVEMRKKRDAPVDFYGCEKLAEVPAEPPLRRYQTLISLMLSSQTKVR